MTVVSGAGGRNDGVRFFAGAAQLYILMPTMRARLLLPIAIALVSTGTAPRAVAQASPGAVSAPAGTASAAPIAAVSPATDGGFRLEPRPVIDDVFGDSGEYRKIIDRSLAVGEAMRRTREQFARALQSVLVESRPGPGKPAPAARSCPERAVAAPYARAYELGQGYLRAGRELTHRHEQVRDLDRLGETVGLTPDYRAKVKRVFSEYQALLIDYREMRIAFHDQLSDELRFARCDLSRLLARAGATADDDPWPGAEGLALGDDPSAPVARPAPAVPGSTAPAGATPSPRSAAGASTTPDRSGVLFYVDNTRCPTAASVVLDGRPLGQVPAAGRAAWQTTPGPHELCLLSDLAGPTPRRCGEPGTVHHSYLHEGWTIALRCE